MKSQMPQLGLKSCGPGEDSSSSVIGSLNHHHHRVSLRILLAKILYARLVVRKAKVWFGCSRVIIVAVMVKGGLKIYESLDIGDEMVERLTVAMKKIRDSFNGDGGEDDVLVMMMRVGVDGGCPMRLGYS
ncbi:hypothetical protein V6N12_015045 [Hibiscus sabdariffa]|uniref:Uncharacterized protein n=1 Tax=Hibiscus sabdariffa TaxID=183260 RepID=A0ABR2DQ02_9ROSI